MAEPERDVRVVLAHGASGNAASMRRHVEGLQARGVDAHAIDLPKRKAEDAVPAYLGALDALPRMPAGRRLVVGGHSYGGRVASLLVAGVNVPPVETSGSGAGLRGGPADLPPVVGLVCFSYPLHLPGRPERGLRTNHWEAIPVPTLILEGESDPFARIDLLRSVMPLLAEGRLVTYPGLGHGLLPVLDRALDDLVAWLDEVLGPRSGPPVIADAPAAQRYEAHLDGALVGVLEYVVKRGRIALIHTEVAAANEGRGIAAGLARFALDDARRRGLRVIASCPYVRSYLAKHPEDDDIVVGTAPG